MPNNYKNLIIQSNKIILTALTKDFADDILAGNNGNVRDFFIPFENKEEVEEWIESNFKLMEKGEKIELVMLNENQDFVGMLSIRELTTNPIFGLWITPSMQNKGYAKKGMNLFIEWLFENTDLTTLTYTVDTKNTPSIALAKSLGGKHTRNFIDEDGEDTSEFVFKKN